MTIEVERDRTDFALELLVSRSGVGGVTGLTATVALREKATVDNYLDFSDNTFKTAGWTTQFAPLTDLLNGRYRRSLDLTVVVGLPTTPDLVAEYSVTGSEVAVTDEEILLTPRAVIEKLRKESVNREEVDFGTSEIIAYDDDGTTIVQRWDVTDNDDNPVVPQPGMITKRGVPKL